MKINTRIKLITKVLFVGLEKAYKTYLVYELKTLVQFCASQTDYCLCRGEKILNKIKLSHLQKFYKINSCKLLLEFIDRKLRYFKNDNFLSKESCIMNVNFQTKMSQDYFVAHERQFIHKYTFYSTFFNVLNIFLFLPVMIRRFE